MSYILSTLIGFAAYGALGWVYYFLHWAMVTFIFKFLYKIDSNKKVSLNLFS